MKPIKLLVLFLALTSCASTSTSQSQSRLERENRALRAQISKLKADAMYLCPPDGHNGAKTKLYIQYDLNDRARFVRRGGKITDFTTHTCVSSPRFNLRGGFSHFVVSCY